MHYPGIKTWNARHRSWLAHLKLEHSEQRFVLEGDAAGGAPGWRACGAPRAGDQRSCPRLVAGSNRARANAMRGIDLVSAVTFLAEIGDLARFEIPRQLMAYLGLVPSGARRARASSAAAREIAWKAQLRLCKRGQSAL